MIPCYCTKVHHAFSFLEDFEFIFGEVAFFDCLNVVLRLDGPDVVHRDLVSSHVC
jgi:hypothetical protein